MTTTIRIIDKAATVACPNCGTKVKSSSSGTTHCPKCNAAVKNPKGKNPANTSKKKPQKTRHNGPKSNPDGFYPSKKPKGPANDPKDKGSKAPPFGTKTSASNSANSANGGSKTPSGPQDSAPDQMTPEQKKVYQQAYNKVLAQTKDKVKADKAGKAAVKASGVSKSEFIIEATVSKTTDQMQAFGWAYMSEKNGQPVTDHSGEWAPIAELEKGAYRYNLESRDAGELHISKGVGTLIESVVFTEEKYLAMGFSEGMAKSLPKGWWIGYQIENAEVWKKVKSGEYPMLSIHGKAVRKEIVEGDEAAADFDTGGAELVLAAKMEVAKTDSYEELSKTARAYIHLQGTSIRSERMSKGKGPGRHGPSVKCPDIYEALKREGKSKTTAAKMSNECFSSGDCNCH